MILRTDLPFDVSKAQFAARSLLKRLSQTTTCPYCESEETTLLQRKHVVLELRKCDACSLQFRFPKDDLEDNISFYQERYRQDDVTDLPDEQLIPSYIEARFHGVGRDLTTHLATIEPLIPSGHVLDYGCSWGYCAYQFKQAGYQAYGFEISKPRVEYGRRVLGLELSSDIDSFPDNSFDGIYSAHCLEHIPNPNIALSQFQRLLKVGGYLFLYVPNCSGDSAKSLGVNWGPMIGEKHVLALTAEFFHKNLERYSLEAKYSSSPYSLPAQPYDNHPPIEGEELLVIGRKIQ